MGHAKKSAENIHCFLSCSSSKGSHAFQQNGEKINLSTALDFRDVVMN